jgi:hypothetical protein
MGIDASHAKLSELAQRMHAALAPFGDSAALLTSLARQVVERDR